MLILLVEDDEPLAASIVGALEAQHWRVDVSARGEPVPLSLERGDYDVLVLDIGLPGIDGYELAQRMRAMPAGAGCRLLAVTGYGLPEDRARTEAAGFDAHFVKPVDVDALLRALRP